MYYLGIDVGSLSCDAVLINDQEEIVSTAVTLTGARNQEAIARVTEESLSQGKITSEQLAATVSTGYGRARVDNRLAAVTEITCHARGIQALHPGAELLIDIGGQDSKAIRMDAKGQVIEFAMNDKCAAGTGRFLEAMARAMEVDIEELSRLDKGSNGNLTLSSMCTVFAESEVVSLIADGVKEKEIVGGLNRAIAFRTLALLKRVVRDTEGLSVAMSGGVAYNSGVVRALGSAMKNKIFVPEQPDIVGALGAAIIGREKFLSQKEQ